MVLLPLDAVILKLNPHMTLNNFDKFFKLIIGFNSLIIYFSDN